MEAVVAIFTALCSSDAGFNNPQPTSALHYLLHCYIRNLGMEVQRRPNFNI